MEAKNIKADKTLYDKALRNYIKSKNIDINKYFAAVDQVMKEEEYKTHLEAYKDMIEHIQADERGFIDFVNNCSIEELQGELL